MEKCPGRYCGRMPMENGTFSDCGACARGWKRDESYICQPCNGALDMDDYQFLTFSCIVPLLIHLFLIDFVSKQNKFSKQLMYLYLSAVVEVSLSALLSILLSEPMFSFKIFSCGVTSISDFYTFLFNPSPNYEKTLICTQERVYPLQTMILGFYLFCVTFMLLLRPFVNDKCKSNIKNCSLAVYYALYAFPVLAMIHALAGGLIYFAFPYLSIIISCSFNAGHFAMKLDQSTKSLLLTSVTEFRNVIIIVGNWLLFFFGIVSIKKYYLLILTPVPSIFYILTAKFTAPD